VDYGLSYGDVRLHRGYRFSLKNDLTYAKDQWQPGLLVLFTLAFVCAFAGYCALGVLPSWGFLQTMLIAALSSVMLWGILLGVSESCFNAYRRRKSRSAHSRYQDALQLHELYQSTAQAAAHEAKQAILRKKRSYWEVLDGYEFERATAEVLRKHQFMATVTRGSGDGGVDIEVTRNGLRGVVQCKAHVACAGPNVVRDLYGVIHHCGAAFGIVVSRGGFSQGAINFARDKPILFLNTDDLIAMQEGRDVLAAAFIHTKT
jgi:HJR/Mrr/RecB family endonuclease